MYGHEILHLYLNYNDNENWQAQIYFSSLTVRQLIFLYVFKLYKGIFSYSG
jgi:hypothetical protein